MWEKNLGLYLFLKLDKKLGFWNKGLFISFFIFCLHFVRVYDTLLIKARGIVVVFMVSQIIKVVFLYLWLSNTLALLLCSANTMVWVWTSGTFGYVTILCNNVLY